jgi:hypothetical protein
MPHFSLPADFDLSDHFDHATLMRAIGLKPDRALLAQHEDGDRLQTRLRGSGSEICEQTISFFTDPRTGLHLRGLCTCAVGFNCHHVAAALMAHEAGLARARRMGLSGSSGVAASELARHATDTGAANEATSQATHLQAGDQPVRLAERSSALSHELEAWLGHASGVLKARVPVDAAVAAPVAAGGLNKRLMYVLSASAARLELRLYLGTARRSGEISRHQPHSPAIADMLRTRPSYVTPADETVLAALLPFVLERPSPPFPLQGRTCTATLRQLVQSGSCWLVDDADGRPATPPGAPLAWLDEPLALQLCWATDADEMWRTRWDAEGLEAGTQVLSLVLLPEPHVLLRDVRGLATMRAADVSSSNLGAPVIRWLAGMPAVSSAALPALVEHGATRPQPALG